MDRIAAWACGERRKVGVGLAGPIEIVDVSSLAGDETLVLFAAYGCADPCGGHDVLPCLRWPHPARARRKAQGCSGEMPPASRLACGFASRPRARCLGRACRPPYSAACCSRRPGHGLGAGGNRLDDVVVAGAAAQIAFELGPDGLLVEARAPCRFTISIADMIMPGVQ